jgi:2-polyprenyl-3-methyl-5-hydroxy-6-metoxy-1,4-benzoquinol methylase
VNVARPRRFRADLCLVVGDLGHRIAQSGTFGAQWLFAAVLIHGSLNRGYLQMQAALQDAGDPVLLGIAGSLSEFVASLSPEHDFEWAFDHYKETVLAAVAFLGAKSVLEIGGGRTPLFSDREIASLGIRYTVNDVAPEELSLAPDTVEKRCFDIAGEISERGSYDLMFSHQVFEHLKNTRRAYVNTYNLLRPGGAVLNFHPTLYALPFVLNKYLPETLALRLLRVVYPEANRATRKFPAYYSWCVATEKAERMIRSIGFREVKILPFYGYNYLWKIPIIRQIDRAVTNWVANADFRSLAAYAYTFAQK